MGIVPQPILLISFHYLNRNETHLTPLNIAFNIWNIIFVSIVDFDVSMSKKKNKRSLVNAKDKSSKIQIIYWKNKLLLRLDSQITFFWERLCVHEGLGHEESWMLTYMEGWEIHKKMAVGRSKNPGVPVVCN